MHHAAYVFLKIPLPNTDLHAWLWEWSLYPLHGLHLTQAIRGRISVPKTNSYQLYASTLSRGFLVGLVGVLGRNQVYLRIFQPTIAKNQELQFVYTSFHLYITS